MIQYNKINLTDNEKARQLFNDCVGLVESSSEEVHLYYFKLQELGYKIEQIGSIYSFCIGYFHNIPIVIVFNFILVNDNVVAFYYPTSNLVNYDMINKWLKSELPKIKNKSNTANIHNVLNAANIKNTAKYMKENTLNFLKNEYDYKVENINKHIKYILDNA